MNDKGGETDAFQTQAPVLPARLPRADRHPVLPGYAKEEDARYRNYQRDPKINRRYDHRWRKIRAAYVEAHPLCEDCLAVAGTRPWLRPTT